MNRLLAILLLTTAAAAHADVPAAEALAQRLLGERAEAFTFEVALPDPDGDVFEIEAHDGQVTIGGSSGVAMASGLNWYLKYHCDSHVSFYGDQLDLPSPLPDVDRRIRRVSPHRHRYFLNYCCFGYSLPWWDWPEWERLIDWMALNGINMPLAVTGQEAVWRAVGERLGLTDAEMAEFLAGPPYLPFGWMGCLDGYGGPLPESWIDRRAELQKRILARQRSLGMTPVLQGFTGHVPEAIGRIYPDAELHTIHWIDWQTRLLEPTSQAFQELGRAFLEEQQKLFGTDHLYAADTFIEMNPPSGETDYLASLSQAILSGMTSVDPEATWVLQGWIFVNNPSFWTEPRARAFFDAVPDDRLLLLDLFCETSPAWSKTEAFYGKPWLWCVVQNFGRTTRLEGNLPRINADLNAARVSPESGRMSGLGMVNEGLGYNPIVYDFINEMAWRKHPVNLDAWVRDYSDHRYGARLAGARSAWSALLQTVYSGNAGSASNVSLRPGIAPRGSARYDHEALLTAWRSLLACSDRLADVDTYRFDVVNVGRQVLVNLAPRLHTEVTQAFRAGDAAALAAASRRYAELLLDLDRLLATREEFLLGADLARARRWGDTPDERARMEWNARNIITRWGDTLSLNDYARKEWAGLIEGFHLKRWQTLVEHMQLALAEERDFDSAAYIAAVVGFERQWASASDRYPAKPRGDSVAIGADLAATYGEHYQPDAVSLTTGKPTSCSAALPPYPKRLANDGITWDTNAFWATDVGDGGEAWWQVDLEEPTSISRVVVVSFYGDVRHYGFTVKTSLDGQSWSLAAERRDNTEPSTELGYTCEFEPRLTRFIRVELTHNSANSGRHLVEVMAYER